MTDIQKWLFDHQDVTYRDFNAKLVPTIEKDTVIGVRTPQLRAYAKELRKEGREQELLGTLPHQYFEENQLHVFLLAQIKDFSVLLTEIQRFLPYVDNWATCDQFRSKTMEKHRDDLLEYIPQWLHSDQTYTIRFGLGMLNSYYLGEDFKDEYLLWAAEIKSEEYYVNIMRAWFFATALTKQYDRTLPLFEAKSLDKWTHNKAIQKARESYRIPKDRKDYLKSLKL